MDLTPASLDPRSHPPGRTLRPALYLTILLLVPGLLLQPEAADAQGFAFYQHGACAMARGGATVAAPCQDGSAVFYNPAALAGLDGWSGSVGSVGVFSRGDFTSDRTRSTVGMDNDPRVAPHLYLGYGIDDRLAVGLGVYAPYGFGTRWPAGFGGAFVSFDSSLEALFIQPTVAYRLTDRISLGVGLTVATSEVELNRHLDLSRQAVPGVGVSWAQLGIPPRTAFAEASLESDRATGVGGHLGIHALWSDRLQFGARFLTPVTLDYEGTARFTQLETGITLPSQNPLGVPGGTPLDAVVSGAFSDGPLVEQAITTQITLPAQFAVGLGFEARPDLVLTLDYQWVNWSTFDSVEIAFESPSLNQTLTQDYRDASVIRAGAEYELTDEWRVRGGYVYNQAASPPENVTPLVPEGERNHLTGGLGWEVSSGIHLEGAYHYLMQNDRRGRTLESPGSGPATVDLNDGLYTVHAHLVGFTLSVTR